MFGAFHMTMPNHVLMMVAGFKDDYIIRTIREYPSRKIYLLVPHDGDTSDAANSVRTIVDGIIDTVSGIMEIEPVKVHIHDFSHCFGRIMKVVRREMAAGNEVIFSISTGERVPVMAGYMVATLEGCTVIHVIPEHYHLRDGMYAAEGTKRFIEIPKLPVDLPRGEERSILFALRELGCSATSMAQLVEHIRNKPEFTGDGATDPAAVRSRLNYYLPGLVRKGCVRTEKEGRETGVHLTLQGQLVAEGLMGLEGR